MLLLVIVIYFYVKRYCISKNLILINLGLIVAGVPFPSIMVFQIWFWIIGGVIAASGIVSYIKDKITRKKFLRCDNEK